MENELDPDPAVVVPPWLDLPTHLAEDILERLPLSGYVRFAAVCRQWRSIQTSHRRRHAPSPPPMRRLPWLIPYYHGQEAVSCYSPLEDRSYIIRLPSNNGATSYGRVKLFTHGWMLAQDSGHHALFNPISATKIDLPRQEIGRERRRLSIVSPPPNYVVSVMFSPICVALLRWCDPVWSMLSLPWQQDANHGKISSISCGGKHYYIISDDGLGCYESYAEDLLVVDPLPTPTIQFFKMMRWGKLQGGAEGRYGATYVVEFDGELLLVKEIIKNRDKRGFGLMTIIIGFRVFRADLCKKMWVRVESLGDHVLFVHQDVSFSLLAADVSLKRNCVYFSTLMKFGIDSGEAPWRVFDLGTGTVADVLLPNATHVEKRAQFIFVPSIC